jgi:hypothetical protein
VNGAIRDQRVERALLRSAKLADLLDTRLRIPGTRIRFGLDPLISLIPVAGDTLALILGLYPVVEAVRFRLGLRIVVRMLLNLGIDWLVGLVPLIGFVPDVIYKANLRNAALLQRSLREMAHDAATEGGA